VAASAPACENPGIRKLFEPALPRGALN